MAIVDKRGTDSFPNNLNDIDSGTLTQGGNEVHLYAGSYAANTDLVATNYAFVGMGERDDVIIDGGFTISDSSSGTITFKNIHFRGADAQSNQDARCVVKSGNTAVTLHFVNCKFSNAEIGVENQSNLTSVGTGLGTIIEYCDMSGVDQAVVSNSNSEISFSQLNTSSNSYYTVGNSTLNGDPKHTCTVRASTSGGSNAGNMTETVLALIS